jgi:hypothetical protein
MSVVLPKPIEAPVSKLRRGDAAGLSRLAPTANSGHSPAQFDIRITG